MVDHPLDIDRLHTEAAEEEAVEAEAMVEVAAEEAMVVGEEEEEEEERRFRFWFATLVKFNFYDIINFLDG
jgi:hypothetical protein